MEHINILESEFDFTDWDDSEYVFKELNESVSGIQLMGGIMSNDDPGFGVRIYYHIENADGIIFSISGTKHYSFPKEYASIHLVTFLTEKAIKEFDKYFIERKKGSKVDRCVIKPRNVGEIFDDLVEALSLIRSAS